MAASASKAKEDFRSRLKQAAEESKSPVRPTVNLWTAIMQAISGPPNGAVPNEDPRDKAEAVKK